MTAAYFDASVLVSLFVADSGTERARAFMAPGRTVTISDLGAAEVASAINLMVRMSRLTLDQAKSVLDAFDAWTSQVADSVEITPADMARAAYYLRRLDLPLRTPDAVHIAIAERLGLPLATLDLRMGEAAAALGVALETGDQA